MSGVGGRNSGAPGRTSAKAALAGLTLLLASCALPGSAAPVVKIGVIAPFEGAGRPLGYAVLPAIQAVVAEANAGAALGAYRVAVVAFNDDLDPDVAANQARALALDPDVAAVIGPFTQATTNAARSIFEGAELRFEPVISADPLDGDYSEEIAAATEATRAVLAELADREEGP